MRRKNLILSLLAASLLWSFPVSAALHSGIYVGLMAGGSLMRSKINKKMEKDGSFVSTLALGGRVGSVRGALELMMNTKVNYKGANEKISYNANGLSAQFYYDVPVRSMFRPFFNAGIGMYGSEIKGDPDVNDKNNKFMWNVGTGVSLAISRSTNVDLGYRYVRFAKENYTDGNKNEIPIETEVHQVYLGYRYVF
ncbi:MAG: porin family protein [Alphaproteobacteria bacterium]|nr:porin family protein [Alphaproteobacteria bacterium]